MVDFLHDPYVWNRPFQDGFVSPDWHLGGRVYAPVADLASGPDCAFHLVRQDQRRFLVQIWSPRPTDRELDSLREEYLQFTTQAEPTDNPGCRFGFDDGKVWLIQELQGISLARLWTELGPGGRRGFQEALQGRLQGSPFLHLLTPESIHVKAGRILVPRILGRTPVSLEGLWGSLKAVPLPKGEGLDPWPWDLVPEFPFEAPRPVQGRLQELTYLKSLILGLNATIPMERVVVLQGEEGLGHDQLADWTAAAAQSEGFWVSSHEVQHEDSEGAFLERVLQDLLLGREADFYAEHPDVARTLSRRMASFAFLRGGRHGEMSKARVDPAELAAALTVLAFATRVHPRILEVRNIERAGQDFQECLKELVLQSQAPWSLTYEGLGQGQQMRTLLGPLRSHPDVAIVNLNRLEDRDLRNVLADLLGPHDLPAESLDSLCTASLGNPGLLQTMLEMAQLEGTLLWSLGRWILAPGAQGTFQARQDLVTGILGGRIQRLGPVPSAVLRILALADHPLPTGVIGRALGLQRDPLDEAIHVVVNAKLAHAGDARIAVSRAQVRELTLDRTPPPEITRLARALLKALNEEAGRPVLSVRLQSIASDRATALAQVMEAIDQEPPGPEEAERVVEQTLLLEPSPLQRARLWEFLGDAWTQATSRGRLPSAQAEDRLPHQWALEALERAEGIFRDLEGGEGDTALKVRILSKKAFLEIRLRKLLQALHTIQEAAECLADHPFHPEQPRLRLALGRIHHLQGHLARSAKALEEGLQILDMLDSGTDRRDRARLMLELGMVHGQRGQFQRAIATIQAAQRLQEHDQEYGGLVAALDMLAQIHLAMGLTDQAYGYLRDGMQAARLLDDTELISKIHFEIGIFRSCQQMLGPALTHLDRALDRSLGLGDRPQATRIRLWKARTLAALGDGVQADLTLLQALGTASHQLSSRERGEQALLQAEIAGFSASWRDASRLYLEAAQGFESAGIAWMERLARLRHIQAEAGEAHKNRTQEGLEAAWILLENLKGSVEGSGSRWLDMEWHKAHALLLPVTDAEETLVFEALSAWGEVLTAARELRFPAATLEACARSAEWLVQQGERLGARSRLQEAFAAFQELWTRIPATHEMSFLGRPDMHAFRLTVEAAGLRFVLPERVDPLADWTPTQVTFPLQNPVRNP